MREIKFRAWHKTAENAEPTMTYFKLEHGYGLNTNFFDAAFNKRHGVGGIMQFTGLKDKNGKEIYEGDIVQRGVIVFHNGKFQGQYFSEGVMYELWEDDLCQEKGIEVIGNIHQHPELIS